MRRLVTFRLSTFWTVLTALGLLACGSGIDGTLETLGTEAEFQESLQAALKDMSKDERAATSWALSDLNLPELRYRYPKASPREVIRGEAARERERLPAAIARTQREKAEYDVLVEELSKVVATDATFRFERDAVDPKPEISATVVNGSRWSFIQLEWRAELFLDDDARPIAAANVFDSYERVRPTDPDGLGPGWRSRRTLHITGLTETLAWSTIEVRSAKTYRIRLTLIPSSVQDKAEHHFVGRDPAETLQKQRASLAAAERYAEL